MEESGSPHGVFELHDGTDAGSTSATSTADVLGVWTAVPAPPATGIAFDAAAEAAPEAPVWRANLPADPHQAAEHLKRAEAELETSRRALGAAEDRIETLVGRKSTGVAFGVPGAQVFAVEPGLAEPEQDLLALLREAETGQPPVSYGLGEKVEGLREAAQQFQDFAERARRIVAHYAWVETRVQDQLLGQTTVGWTGNMRTAWQEGLAPEQMTLHRRTLALALASRETLIRTFTIVASGAAKLSLLLSAPGGAILALPAAWKFINQVRAEIERHQQVTRGVVDR